jgi:hypothetical protein
MTPTDSALYGHSKYGHSKVQVEHPTADFETKNRPRLGSAGCRRKEQGFRLTAGGLMDRSRSEPEKCAAASIAAFKIS